MAVGSQADRIHPLALRELRQTTLGVVGLTAGEFVDGLHVRLEEPGEGDGAPTGRESRLASVAGLTGDPQAQRGAAGVGHLGGDGALPDQLVETEPVVVEFGVQRSRGGEGIAGGPDGLVGLLGVLDLAGVLTRRRMHVLVAVQLASLGARGVDGRLRQGRRVGTHISDVAVLVEPLGHAHGALGGEPQLAAGFLLQRRGHERRVRPTGVRLLLHRGDRQRGAPQAGGQRTGARFVEHLYLGGLAQHAEGIEVAPGGHPLPVDGDQAGVEPGRVGGGVGDAGVQFGEHIPVRGTTEGHPLALALNDDARRDGLHAAGRELRGHLLPEHRADLVAVQPVEDATGLLGVDEIDIQVARVLGGSADRRLGDFVEHHPADRHAGLERLQQVPGDGFTLAVTVGGQIELVDVLEEALEFADRGLLVRADDVKRLEVAIDVHPQTGPLLRLVLGGHVGSALGQVPDMAAGGLHDVIAAQISGDLAGFGGRLDDDKTPNAAVGATLRTRPVVVRHLRSRSNSVRPRLLYCPQIPPGH